MSCNQSNNSGITILQCKTGNNNSKVVTFSDNNFSIKQGSNTLFSLPLGGFHLPIERYLYTEISIQPGEDINLLYTGSVGDATGKIKILSVFSVYDEKATVNDAYFEWAFNDGSLKFKPSGPLLILTGQENHLIDSIIIRNSSALPILIKVVVGK